MNEIGVYGLGVMGKSLALNLAGHGLNTAVYNKYDHEAVTSAFVRDNSSLPLSGYRELEDFVLSLEKPRKIILMITAGNAVDAVITELEPLLEEGDVIADCGNSFYKDTMRREASLKKKGICFFGVGVSGGEKGALTGPSIMPGGDRSAYDASFGRILETIAAKNEDGTVCCDYIGPDGAGHYVKMVHNGIEYGDMQIICEAYELMKYAAGMTNEEMADVFEEWNRGRLNSYLVEITASILRRRDDESGGYLIDSILDEAGQKGTGKWTSMEALDIGTPVPGIAESVFARCISARKEERLKTAVQFPRDTCLPVEKEQFLQDLEQAVYAAKIISYAQGFSLLKDASAEHGWNLDFGSIAMLWRNGCIIRASFLERIKDAYTQEDGLVSLMNASEFERDIRAAQQGWRRTVIKGIESGLYLPVLTASLQYFDGMRSALLPANLLQAQRDCFGAHTYRRTDRPHEESFHTDWDL